MTPTEYREKNRERIRAYDREYIQRPEVKAKRKAYALANKDKINKQRREKYAKKTHKAL